MSDWSDIRRLLVVRLDNIGDVIMLGPALRALKSAMPGASMTLMASAAGALAVPLLPWIEDALVHRAPWQELGTAARSDGAGQARLVTALERARFDAVFIFTSFAQSPYPPAYAALLAGIPLRVGQSTEWGGTVLTHLVRPGKQGGHQVDRNLHMLEEVGIPEAGRQLEVSIPDQAHEEATCVLAGVGIRDGEDFVAVAPGSSRQATRYPAVRYAQAVGLLARRSGLPIVVVGASDEQELASAVAAGAPEASSVAGRLTLPGLAAVLQRSAVTVCNNTAPMHLADAVGTPTVVLYSGTELEMEFVPRSSHTRLLGRGTECTPCRLFDCPRSRECLDVEPEIVAWAAVAMMEPAQRLVPDVMEAAHA